MVQNFEFEGASMKRFPLVLSLMFLVSCGDNSIEKVKSMVTSVDDSITIGNAYDNRKICKSIDWKEYKDERDRDIVKYTCELSSDDANASIDYYLNDAFNKTTVIYDKDIKKINEDIEKTNSYISNLTANLKYLQILKDSNLVDSLYKSISKLNDAKGRNYLDFNTGYDSRISSILANNPNSLGFPKKNERFFDGYRQDLLEHNEIDVIPLLNDVENKIIQLQKFMIAEQIYTDNYKYTNEFLNLYVTSYLNNDDYNSIVNKINEEISSAKERILNFDKKINLIEKHKDKIIIFKSELEMRYSVNSITQSVYFTIVNNKPKIYGCEFNVKTNHDQYSLSPKYCLKMSYSSGRNTYFEALANLIYKTDLEKVISDYDRQQQIEYKKFR